MIGLWQVDGKLPNLALMKLSAWLKVQGHETVLQRDPDSLTRYASVIFTRNRPQVEMWRQAYDFEVGGSGWDLCTTLPAEVERMVPDYDLYGIDYAMGYLSRGCIRNCPFCIVREKEGWLKQVRTLAQILRPGCDRVMLLDNNFMALPTALGLLHEMAYRRVRVSFTQGLDIRLVTLMFAQALAGVDFRDDDFKRRRVHFAFDDVRLEGVVRSGIDMLFTAGIEPDALSFYVLVGYNSTFAQDVHRCEVLRELGIKPYVMRYKKTRALNGLARWANGKKGEWRIPFMEYDRARYEGKDRVAEEQGYLFEQVVIDD